MSWLTTCLLYPLIKRLTWSGFTRHLHSSPSECTIVWSSKQHPTTISQIIKLVFSRDILIFILVKVICVNSFSLHNQSHEAKLYRNQPNRSHQQLRNCRTLLTLSLDDWTPHQRSNNYTFKLHMKILVWMLQQKKTWICFPLFFWLTITYKTTLCLRCHQWHHWAAEFRISLVELRFNTWKISGKIPSTLEPRKKQRPYFPLNPACSIGILIMAYDGLL